MKVKEIMERCGMQETGKAIAYIKDGLQELEMLSSENVHSGSRAYLQGTTFSVIASADTGQIANNTAWTDASGSALTNGADDLALSNIITNRTALTIRFGNTGGATADTYYEGSAFLTSFSVSAGTEDTATYSMSFEGTRALTQTIS